MGWIMGRCLTLSTSLLHLRASKDLNGVMEHAWHFLVNEPGRHLDIEKQRSSVHRQLESHWERSGHTACLPEALTDKTSPDL